MLSAQRGHRPLGRGGQHPWGGAEHLGGVLSTQHGDWASGKDAERRGRDAEGFRGGSEHPGVMLSTAGGQHPAGTPRAWWGAKGVGGTLGASCAPTTDAQHPFGKPKHPLELPKHPYGIPSTHWGHPAPPWHPRCPEAPYLVGDAAGEVLHELIGFVALHLAVGDRALAQRRVQLGAEEGAGALLVLRRLPACDEEQGGGLSGTPPTSCPRLTPCSPIQRCRWACSSGPRCSTR